MIGSAASSSKQGLPGQGGEATVEIFPDKVYKEQYKKLGTLLSNTSSELGTVEALKFAVEKKKDSMKPLF